MGVFKLRYDCVDTKVVSKGFNISCYYSLLEKKGVFSSLAVTEALHELRINSILVLMR